MPRRNKGASSLAKLTRSVAKRKRRKAKPRANPGPRRNPALTTDLWEFIVPGLVSYAAVRIAGRIAYKIGRKKSVAWAKHLGAIVPAVVAAGGYLAVHTVPSARKYHAGVVIGATIGAVQSLAQAYIPQWSWILNDYHLDDVLPAAQPPAQQPALGPAPAGHYAPPQMYAAPAQQPAQQQQAAVAPPLTEPNDPQDDILDQASEAWGMGADDAALDQLERELGLN